MVALLDKKLCLNTQLCFMLIINFLMCKMNKCFMPYGIYSVHENQSKVCEFKKQGCILKRVLLKNDERRFFKNQKMLLDAMNLLYCKINVTQRICIEYIGKIKKGALDVFSSAHAQYTYNASCRTPICLIKHKQFYKSFIFAVNTQYVIQSHAFFKVIYF